MHLKNTSAKHRQTHERLEAEQKAMELGQGLEKEKAKAKAKAKAKKLKKSKD